MTVIDEHVFKDDLVVNEVREKMSSPVRMVKLYSYLMENVV